MEAQAVLDEMDTNHRDNVRSSTRMCLVWCVLCAHIPRVIKTSRGSLGKISSGAEHPHLLHPGLKWIQGTLEMNISTGLLLMKPD